MSRRAWGALAGVCLAARASSVEAQEPDAWRGRPTVLPGDDGTSHRAPQEAARPVAGEPAVEPEDVALAVPRLVLAVPRVAFNIALTPVHGLAYVTGRYQIPERVIDILYNDERTAAVLPYVSFLGSRGFTLGASAFHAGLGRHQERVAVSARFGGGEEMAYQVDVSAPRVGGTPLALEAKSRFEMVPDQGFWGIGPSRQDRLPAGRLAAPRATSVETEFRQRRFLTKLFAGWAFSNSVQLGVIGSFNRRDFGPKAEDGGPPTIEHIYDVSQLVGFEAGYTLVEPLATLRVDTRSPAGRTASGINLDAFAGGPPPQQGFGFFHYGAAFTGFLDLYGGDRILVLHGAHEGTSGDAREIPFADLPRLGGPRRLRGYEPHQFRDKLSMLLVAEYHYPVHDYMDASLFIEMGSVGPDYEALIQPRNYRLSGGGGLLFRTKEAKLFSVQLAYGDGVQIFFTSDPLETFTKKGEEL